ncbi:DUF4229 domain-containing protein [Microcella humidisoli]|uniref:DUF4229 domain-containing protein n=1 Tax=Microcella humidisoli TaxID=2963406 RepID=A0ABY5FY88_9MICO|nr:DUF4229 domain-containing protein [Microcella humidisoli]UTT63254.1 DUF4229 domain-containing protein [Microcella humidisoli]
MSPWIQYSLVRLGLFGVSFGLLMAVSLDWWWAAIIATIIAMTVSYIFFSSLRDAVALDLAARRERPAADPDAEAEDAAADERADDAAEDAARP